ncbi:MAG: helix-turn-helix transcriptional regulator [Thermomicrobiales bacterium]|nr:helix-turn-helix transcriptional regulator [Thermomicrobiales bacterium]
MVSVDGVKLRQWRERRLLTLRGLSEKSGVAFATLQRIESGKQEPRPSTLRQILHALEVAPEDVLAVEEDDERGKAAA